MQCKSLFIRSPCSGRKFTCMSRLNSSSTPEEWTVNESPIFTCPPYSASNKWIGVSRESLPRTITFELRITWNVGSKYKMGDILSHDPIDISYSVDWMDWTYPPILRLAQSQQMWSTARWLQRYRWLWDHLLHWPRWFLGHFLQANDAFVTHQRHIVDSLEHLANWKKQEEYSRR